MFIKKYFKSSILSGFLIGFAVIFSTTFSQYFNYSKIASSIIFPIGLMTIVILKAQLFTGNIYNHALELKNNEISCSQYIEKLIFCYIGNFVGILITIFIYLNLEQDTLNSFILSSQYKVNLPIKQLFFYGLMCNSVVCLIVSLNKRIDNILAKIFVIFIILPAMVYCGYEHSIANMFTLSIGYFYNAISFSQLLYNLSVSTAGNILGGLLIYFITEE